MKKLFLIAFTIISFNSYSQIKATTSEGKKVLLFEDGTWVSDSTSNTKTSGSSYECIDLTKVSTDKMTGRISSSSKETLIVSDDGGKNGFGIYIIKSDDAIIFTVQAVGAGNCIDEGNKMNVLFRDGSRLEISNDADFNCKGNFTAYFGGVFGKRKILEQLISKEVETMRVWTSDGYVERDFTNDQSLILTKTIECLK